MLFVLEAQSANEMWSWTARRTQQWMHDRKIKLAPADDVKMFLKRLRRHSQRAREAKNKELLGIGNCIANPVTKLKVATENFSESMLLGDHGRQWQRQNVKHGGLLDEALDLL